MKNFLPILLTTLLLVTITSNCFSQNKELKYDNKSYESFVGSVQLYPLSGNPEQEMDAPIVPIQLTQTLLLQFDLLLEEYIDVEAKIVHCNADWTKSVLNDIEYLYDYNTFDLRDFEYSMNTKVLYVNYWMNLPRLKKTGNYIIQVYQNGDEKDLLFTRRFIVFENLVRIQPSIKISSGVMARRMNQQIDFDIIHSRLKVSNPHTDFKVVVRQNQRIDNAIMDLKPTAVRRDKSLVEYRHFNMENNFKGGNEFRLADLRTYSYRGAYVSHINPDADPREIEIIEAKSRKHEAYSMLLDKNGSFYIGSSETFGDYLSCDYILTKFQLKSHQLMENVYVVGAFNNWAMNEKSMLKYDNLSQSYKTQILLKQGSYDYIYWVDTKNDDPYQFEGSFYQAKNKYEIIVYYKSFSDLTERVVGYHSFKTGF
jgi:hypothetical protein